MEILNMVHKKLNITSYRTYLNDLHNKLYLRDSAEQRLYDFIEDSYNSIPDDNLALHKTFVKLENSTEFSFTEKMYGSMMLLLCDLKCQDVRQKSDEKKFKSKFPEDDEYSGDDDDGDEDD